MSEYKETIVRPITGTHLIQFKGYYELDLVNEFSKERFVFTIPRALFDMMILSKEKIKIVARQREHTKPREVPVLTS